MAAPKRNQNAARDYVGAHLGHFTIIENLGLEGTRRVLKCRCVCGKEVVRRRDTLKCFSSCGCVQNANLRRAMIGKKQMLGHVKPGLEATEHPTLCDIAWVAGIYEGEGSTNGPWYTRADGTRERSLHVSIGQVDPWLTERLRALFGGTRRFQKAHHSRTLNGGDTFIWTATGSRARGFLMTIWKFLSPRRHAQILKGGFSFCDAA